MTAEEINRKIALSLGYKIEEGNIVDPDGKEWQVFFGWDTWKDGTSICPDWFGDLNAIVEVVRRLKWWEQEDVLYHLSEIVYRDNPATKNDRFLALATAPQWCEAYLKECQLWD